MTVKQLIKELQKLKNQEANINIIVGNEDEDILSLWDIEVFSERSIDENYIELFCYIEELWKHTMR